MKLHELHFFPRLKASDVKLKVFEAWVNIQQQNLSKSLARKAAGWEKSASDRFQKS